MKMYRDKMYRDEFNIIETILVSELEQAFVIQKNNTKMYVSTNYFDKANLLQGKYSGLLELNIADFDKISSSECVLNFDNVYLRGISGVVTKIDKENNLVMVESTFVFNLLISKELIDGLKVGDYIKFPVQGIWLYHIQEVKK